MSRSAYYEDLKRLALEKRAEYRVDTAALGLAEVRTIYKAEGIRLDHWPLPRKVKALYMCDDGDCSVALQRSLPYEPKLFALIHELKHHYRDRAALGAGVIHCGDYAQMSLLKRERRCLPRNLSIPKQSSPRIFKKLASPSRKPPMWSISSAPARRESAISLSASAWNASESSVPDNSTVCNSKNWKTSSMAFRSTGVAGNTLNAIAPRIPYDAEPFRIEWHSANGPARPTIPIGCVALIAFLAMQVGVHPRTLGDIVLLCGFVRSRPIALGIPPKTDEGACESRRRFGLCK